MKKNSGISVVPLIIALVLMITVGGFFISLMLGKHIGAPLLAQSTKALYIADAGVEYTAIYLRDRIGFDWTDTVNVPNIPSTNFGGGTFAVAFPIANRTPISITANSTGTIGNAVRVISINFEKKSLLSLSPVNWVSEIEIDDNVTVNSTTCSPCEETSDNKAKEPEDDPDKRCSIISPTCANQVTPGQAPTLNPPILPNAAWSCPPTPETSYTGTVTISVDCTFPQGTYFFDELEINSGANVTVTGHVTIWILGEFEMNNSQFNWGGAAAAANLLLLSAGGPDPEPDFEIEDGAQFSGAIYGPQAEIEISDAQVVGAIVGNEVELGDNTTITHVLTAGANNTTDYSKTRVVVKASNWGEK